MRIVEPPTSLPPRRIARVRHECGALVEIDDADARAAGSHVTCPACSMPPWVPTSKLVFVWESDAARAVTVAINEDTEATTQGRGIRAKWAAVQAAADADALRRVR